MATTCRSWWRNCALETDSEMAAIDEMEDRLTPLEPEVSKIRELIAAIELCHHKAEHWVENIIEAIGGGETDKGLGTRSPGQHHPAETVWQNACAALSAWCAGCPATSVDGTVGGVPAPEILGGLGARSPLKEWQVQRVISKIRGSIHWPWSDGDPSARYVWLLLGGGEYEVDYRECCPEHYKEHEDFWLATARTMIHDTENGEAATLSLGLAIDMLWPCHRLFVTNLRIVLDAIGGKLHPTEPFTACGRNISLTPLRPRMESIANTLRAFSDRPIPDKTVDQVLLEKLGEPTPAKQWLAASLDKTIRLQLDPPADLRAVSALSGPDWLSR
ncbi:MAG: hypothetical protein QNK37_32745 [Acidobacteriota bacterium]|nr:hypothetical protein [Acidobacteriota bacterium]